MTLMPAMSRARRETDLRCALDDRSRPAASTAGERAAPRRRSGDGTAVSQWTSPRDGAWSAPTAAALASDSLLPHAWAARGWPGSRSGPSEPAYDILPCHRPLYCIQSPGPFVQVLPGWSIRNRGRKRASGSGRLRYITSGLSHRYGADALSGVRTIFLFSRSRSPYPTGAPYTSCRQTPSNG